jgi:hypothetical protein
LEEVRDLALVERGAGLFREGEHGLGMLGGF